MIKILVVVVVAIVGILVMTKIDPNVQQQDQLAEVSEYRDGNYLTIVIEGQVVNPGAYSMEETKTVGDLIVASGGLLESADENAFNRETPLLGRERVYIPSKMNYAPDCEILDTPKKINVNTASAEQLATINGISEAVAKAIVTYREANGPFMALEDLQNVSGIGTKTYEKIRDYLTLK